jgi:hypothetical protein
MLHACLYTICFVFCYTLWCFYEFSRTNLLTRCHSASSLFLLFLCFRKPTQEIFLELDETKAKVPIFSEASRSPKQRRRGARRQPRHPMARVENGTGTDGNRLYRFRFRMCCRNRKRERKPRKRIQKRQSPKTDTKRIHDGYVTKTDICRNI